MIPDAALAVIEAAHEDARRAHGTTHYAAALAIRELRRAGWTITPTTRRIGGPPKGSRA